MNWHLTTIEEAYNTLGSSPAGLSTEKVVSRTAQFGPNELKEKKKKPAWLIFLFQFRDFMIIILLAAAIISGFIGDITDTIIILTIVFLNAVIGFTQEFKAEKAMESLKKMAAPQARVIRDGKPLQVPVSALVPGDLVIIEAGNMVPADLRLVSSNSLHIDESALTGESEPVDKNTGEKVGPDLPLGERQNMAYKSTLVATGTGTGIAVATGMDTEIGHIAKMLQSEDMETPLKKRMADFGKKLSYVVLIICVILFGIGLSRGEEPVKMLMLSISLAVAAIPEALPALITIALALGARRLSMKNALVRKLPAVETLGSISFICSDKTGTLTMNRMTLVHQYEKPGLPPIDPAISPFLAALALNHDVRFTESGDKIGDPTEKALVDKVVSDHSREELERIIMLFPRVAELPFDANRRCMTTVHGFGNKFLILCKGAFESISGKLTYGQDIGEAERLAFIWANEGARVLAFSYRLLDSLPDPLNDETVEKDLIFCGITGMMDPPREKVKQAIADCRKAGIRPVMITGDHPVTARAIAREIGIMREQDLLLTGSELQAMRDEAFEDVVENVSVYARVSPEQKIRIVKALQGRHHFVSMTGDGVNDAPSLKAADIGVAMGISGTDVSKESADMILLDDNFATIVRAVKEGRRIYDNIRKFVKYILACNSAEILTIFCAPLLGLPMPLLPIHILWINLVTDGLPGLALAGEKAEKDIMNRPPRPSQEGLFAGGIIFHIVWVGLLMAGLTLGTEAFAIHLGIDRWQTMVFTVLSVSQLGQVMAIRSERDFLFRKGLVTNMPLFITVIFTIILQLAVIYLPAANRIFRTAPLSARELLFCFGVAAIIFHAVEMEKWIKARRSSRQHEKGISAK